MLVINIHPTKTSVASNELISVFPCTLGSGKTNDIVIDNATVMPRHLKIELQGDMLVAREIEAGVLIHEGRKVSQVVLHANKTLMLGEVRVDFAIGAKQQAATTGGKPATRPAQVVSASTANTRSAAELPAPKVEPKASAGNTLKFGIMAVVLFAIFKINSTYLSSPTLLPGAGQNTTAQALKDLAPEITDSTAPPTAPTEQATPQPGQPIAQPSISPSPGVTQPSSQSQVQPETSVAPTLLVENMGFDVFRPARTLPEKALSLVTDHPWGPKFFVLLAWALILGTVVRLRSPETPLAVPTFRAVFVFGLLLGIAQILRGALPVLNFNIDNHESFLKVGGMLVIGVGTCAFQALMHFVMPEDSFQKKTVLAAGLTIASSFGFMKAGEKGLIDLNQRPLPFKGTIAFPLRTFNPQLKTVDNLMIMIDGSINRTK